MKIDATHNTARLIVSKALNISANDLTFISKIHDFPEWDSLGHLCIVQSLEEEFNFVIEEEELYERLTNFGEIVALVNSKIVKKGESANG